MKLVRVILRYLELPLREPFHTSYGAEHKKDVIIVETVSDGGNRGFAECVAGTAPLYTSETYMTAWPMLEHYFIPALLEQQFETRSHLMGIRDTLGHFRGHPMAKAALEMAIWDLFAAETDTPLSQLLGGTRSDVPAGISIGIQPGLSTLLHTVQFYVDQGFHRVKLKVKPGWDLHPISALRESFPDLELMVDANSAYTLQDAPHLRQLDAYNLMMVE